MASKKIKKTPGMRGILLGMVLSGKYVKSIGDRRMKRQKDAKHSFKGEQW